MMRMLMTMVGVMVGRWRGGGKLMDLDDRTGVLVLFLSMKCYFAQDRGLLTSVSLVPEGSVRREGNASGIRPLHAVRKNRGSCCDLSFTSQRIHCSSLRYIILR